jgi:cytochrome c oxidase subunit IV
MKEFLVIDNFTYNTYEHWSSIIFSIFLIAICFLSLIVEKQNKKRPNRIQIIFSIVLSSLISIVMIYFMLECSFVGKCFMRWTHYFASDSPQRYAVVFIFFIFFIVALINVAINASALRKVKSYSNTKAKEIAKKRRIEKRIQERAEKKQQRNNDELSR